jgi:hypothetical protein
MLAPGTQGPGRKPVWTWRFNEGNDRLLPYYIPSREDDRTLVFESRFESGNLGLAIKLSDTDYMLLLQNDTLTKGNTQCIGKLAV